METAGIEITTTFTLRSPLGPLQIVAGETYLQAVIFAKETVSTGTEIGNSLVSDHPVIAACCKQLQEYFSGSRKVFDLPLQQPGTAFQQKVWAALTTIGYGETITYLALSKRIGNTKAIRAAGTANGKNNLAIIVPCHRVIGSNGTLVGYAGELWRKKWLLEHEHKFGKGQQVLF